jgi:tetratricopeptide (TPR) repeat protein
VPRQRLRSRLGRAALVLSLFLGAAALVLWLFVRGGCFSPPPAPAPEVEYAGCRAELAPGPVCVLGDKHELTLWVGLPPETGIELRVDGRNVDARGEPVAEGRRFVLILPGEARVVELRAPGHAPWSLTVAGPHTKLPAGSRDLQAAVMAKALAINEAIRDRDLARMRETLAAMTLPPRAVADSRYMVHYYRGMLAEREGDYRSALQEIQQAIAIAVRVKLDVYRWFAEEELALLLRGLGRSHEAAQLFEQLRRRPEGVNPCEEGQLLSNQGWSELLAREAGERIADPSPLLEAALAKYETCEEVMPEKRANVLRNLALAHVQEGRLETAKDLLDRARKLEHPSLPQRLWLLDIEGRIARGEGRPAAALRSFAQLADLAAQTSSFDGRLRALFGEAQAHQALDDPAAALATLAAAEDLLDEQSLQVPIHEGRDTFFAARQSIVSLHLELLLDQGRTAEALAAARRARSRILRQLAQVDRLAKLPPEQRAERSRLLTDYQQRRAALEARAQEDWSRPADEQRHEEAERRVEAQKVQELLDRAFHVLGAPATLRRQGLPPLRAGELILAYHPLAGGWVGFAADEGAVLARRFDLPADSLSRPADLAAHLLLPFRAAIERARRIRVLASGPLEQVDFHALPFDGDVLLRRCPVVYGLDLPVADSPVPPAERRALLVGDPRGDLPGAAAEAHAVSQLLRSAPHSWQVDELGAAGASNLAVRDHLAAADLFHYAGHGSFAGFGGWESSLLLAGDTRMTLGDVLALQVVPAWVMLSACDTGRSTAETPVAGLGLGHAFLLAGSRAVVASTRPTADRSLPAFFTELYTQWDGDSDLDVALQGAQLGWRKLDPQADWASFRLFEP